VCCIAIYSIFNTKGVFLNRKPAKPAAARWTGVPSSAAFNEGILLYHDFMPQFMDMVCHGNRTRKHQDEPQREAHDIDSAVDNYQKQLSTRKNLLNEFAHGGMDAAMKCYGVVQLNRPLRYPLFWILARETPRIEDGRNS
jgi:hypothetical protein